MKMKVLLAATALIAGPSLAAELVVDRVSAPATVQRGGTSSALVPGAALSAGDVVSAGSRGRVALRFNQGQLLLSSLADVQVFDAKPAKGKSPAVGKFKLLAGALRVDSRAAAGKPAQDVRLNIGSLKARILGADAWGANTAEGDTLCVFAGSVGVQTQGSGEERLEEPGSCLRREPDGRLSRFAMSEDSILAGAVAATGFDGTAPAVATAPPPPPVAAAVATPAPIIAAGPSPVAGGIGDWTVVVLSMSRAEPVAERARQLAEQGLPASTRTAEVNGITMHRVAVGQFASQAEARAYAAGTLAKSGIKGWPSRL